MTYFCPDRIYAYCRKRLHMKIHVTLFLVFVIFAAATGTPQDCPTPNDTRNYEEAYGLLFDSQTRAEKALRLLTDDGSRSLIELNERELSLLCYIFNEIGNSEKQLETATALWKRNPNSTSAVVWMSNSLICKLGTPKGVAEVEAFVDDALKKNLGNQRVLLLLKANTILAKKDIPDGKKRLEVTDALIAAYVSDGPPLEQGFLSVVVEPDSIVDLYPFVSFFSQIERESIKERMIKARKNKAGSGKR